MGFDCFGNCANKNIELRLGDDRSDSLVNNQILREISCHDEMDASFTN